MGAFTVFRPLFALIVLAAVASAVSANDTSLVAVGGSAVPLHGEHPWVRMVNGTVRLDLYKGYYTTSVDFLFANEGNATTVMMGFPERGIGTDGAKVDGIIQGFVTTVDGRPVTAKRIKSKSDNDSYQAYWAKSVAFGKNQQHRIHVQFRSPYGAGIGGTLAAYDFTGGNWRGKVAQSRLQVTTHPGAPTLAVAAINDHALPADKGAAIRNFVWHDWEAEGQFVLSEKPR